MGTRVFFYHVFGREEFGKLARLFHVSGRPTLAHMREQRRARSCRSRPSRERRPSHPRKESDSSNIVRRLKNSSTRTDARRLFYRSTCTPRSGQLAGVFPSRAPPRFHEPCLPAAACYMPQTATTTTAKTKTTISAMSAPSAGRTFSRRPPLLQRRPPFPSPPPSSLEAVRWAKRTAGGPPSRPKAGVGQPTTSATTSTRAPAAACSRHSWPSSCPSSQDWWVGNR